MCDWQHLMVVSDEGYGSIRDVLCELFWLIVAKQLCYCIEVHEPRFLQTKRCLHGENSTHSLIDSGCGNLSAANCRQARLERTFHILHALTNTGSGFDSIHRCLPRRIRCLRVDAS